MMIRIIKGPIDPEEARRAVRHSSCGAVATFEGDIRRENDGKRVLGLEYEIYEKLFYSEVKKIIEEIQEKWKIHKIALIQRIGKLDVGETGIIIAVGSPHRCEAMEALSYAIEEFKKRAPVWKKEVHPTTPFSQIPTR